MSEPIMPCPLCGSECRVTRPRRDDPHHLAFCVRAGCDYLVDFFAHPLICERIASFKERFDEYAECLQSLCMNRLYEICRPVSHGWPGKKHVNAITEAVDFLIQRIVELEGRINAPGKQ